MNKLNAEQRKELLDEIDYNRKNCFLSSKTELLMQIAESYLNELPILEQQERGEGEWIGWGGGVCPVSENTFLLVRYRGDFHDDKCTAGNMLWEHSGEEEDIIAYRIIPERDTNQNGEQ